MQNSKPTIFISSTIYDFRDLRSALKYWLEELGYKVMLSEFNDFTKPLDENSYNACLRAIEQANYFILLIGSRTGGFFDATQKVSITRMEYRTAYDLVKAGRMKLITFVREDLWNIKEDRKALEKLLADEFVKQKELETTDVKKIAKYKSTFVNDAEATFSFLNEVGRIEEMKQAMAGKSNLPIANWIHPFTTFQDIIETLSTVLETKRNLSSIALLTNLKRELLYNLTQLTSKLKNGEIVLNTRWGNLARQHYKGDLNDISVMPARYVKWLFMYALYSLRSHKLSTQFIDQALTSGTFLEYDFNSNTYKVGAFHKGLFDLKENINRLKNMHKASDKDRTADFIDKYAPISNPDVKSLDKNLTINNAELTPIIAHYDCDENIVMLCIALLNAINGDSSKLLSLKLNSSSPSESEAKKIEGETTTIEDIENWLLEN